MLLVTHVSFVGKTVCVSWNGLDYTASFKDTIDEITSKVIKKFGKASVSDVGAIVKAFEMFYEHFAINSNLDLDSISSEDYAGFNQKLRMADLKNHIRKKSEECGFPRQLEEALESIKFATVKHILDK